MANPVNGSSCGSAYHSAGNLTGQQVQHKPEAHSEIESIIGQNSRYADDMNRLNALPSEQSLTVLNDIPGPEDSFFPTRTLMVQDTEFHSYTIPACVADVAPKK